MAEIAFNTARAGRRFVYVIASAAGPCKIGFTNAPLRRFLEVRCGSSSKLWFAFLGATTRRGASALEAAAHRRLSAARMEGEWFDVAPKIAIAEVVRTAAILGFRMTDCTPLIGSEALAQIDVPEPSGTSIITSSAVLADSHSADIYARAERSAATLRAYEADLRHFAAWCEKVGEPLMPARAEAVAAYIAHLADGKKSVSTIIRRLAAIAYAHRQMGENDPTATERVKRVTRGIKRTIGTASKQKAPATAKFIRAMLKALPDTILGKRDRAMLLIGFAGAFRRSELVALDVADIDRQPEGILIRIRRSKTDQEGAGQIVAIPRGIKLKPIEALDAWLAAAAITSGPIFRPINRGGRVLAGRLTDQSVALVVKHRAAAAKLDPGLFSGHSLRAGFVTSALEDGADSLRVMDQTRHRSIDTLRKYDRRAKAFTGHAGKGFL